LARARASPRSSPGASRQVKPRGTMRCASIASRPLLGRGWRPNRRRCRATASFSRGSSARAARGTRSQVRCSRRSHCRPRASGTRQRQQSAKDHDRHRRLNLAARLARLERERDQRKPRGESGYQDRVQSLERASPDGALEISCASSSTRWRMCETSMSPLRVACRTK